MMEKFKYRFDKQTRLIYKSYYGNITIEDIHSSWDYAFKENIIPRETIGFILDYRNARFNIKLNEYLEIPEYYREHLDVFGNKRIAIITEDPKDVIIPDLVEKKDSGYESRPFYTLKAAVQWVLENRD